MEKQDQNNKSDKNSCEVNVDYVKNGSPFHPMIDNKFNDSMINKTNLNLQNSDIKILKPDNQNLFW